MRALALKELRDTVIIAAAALAWYLAVTVNAMGAKAFNWMLWMPQGTRGVPFHDQGFATVHPLISGLLAIALGFRQSAWEASQGTYLFLLHRPLQRRTIFLIKLAIGAALFLLCASLPILLYAWWAILPGHHAGPFEWSMTASTWQMMFATLVLYLGAFLSGLRPGRWFGTRLLPLIGTLLIVLFLDTLPARGWWYFGFPLFLLLCGVLLANICFVADVRDYA